MLCLNFDIKKILIYCMYIGLLVNNSVLLLSVDG